MGIVKYVCISTERKKSAKNVHQCQAKCEGIVGDVHYGKGEKQVSLLPLERVGPYFAARKEPILPGRFGENLLTKGLDWESIQVGDWLRAGEVFLEVVRLGAGGPASDAYQGEKVCSPMEEFFIFCKILQEGTLKEDIPIAKEERE